METLSRQSRQAPLLPSALTDRAALPLHLLAIIGGLAMFFWRLGSLPLTTPNEGLFAEVSREMLERNDWITPHINGVVYFEKPPLLYWLTALSMRLFGETAWAARLPSVLAGIGTIYLTWWLGRRLMSGVAAAYAATIGATSIGFLLMARQVMFDALLTCCIAGALAAFWYRAELDDEEKARPALYWFWIALALGVLTKGVLAVLLPFLIIGLYCLLVKERAQWKSLWQWKPIILFLAIIVPWHVMVSIRHPEFLWFYFINEHVLRFLGKRDPADFHIASIFAPIQALFVLTVPWCVFLPCALQRMLPRLREGNMRRREAIFLLLWILVPLVFFTVSGTRTLYYMLPVVPPLVLVLGMLWDDAAVSWNENQRHRRLFLPLLGCYLLVFAIWIWCRLHLGEHSDRAWKIALGFSSVSWLLVGFIVALMALRRNAVMVAFAGVALATVCAGITAMDGWLHFQSMTSEEEMVAYIERQQLRSHTTPIVAEEWRLENHSSFLFYMPPRLRPVYVVNGRWGGDLQFGSQFPNARHLFIGLYTLKQMAAKNTVYYLTEDHPKGAIPPSFRLVHSAGHNWLWSNAA